MFFNFLKACKGVRFKITFVKYLYCRYDKYTSDEILKVKTSDVDWDADGVYQWLTEFIAANGGIVLDPEIFQDIDGIDIRCDVRINLGVMRFWENSSYSDKVSVSGIVETPKGFNLGGFKWCSMKKAEKAIRKAIKRLPQMKREQSEIDFSLPGLTDEQRFGLLVDD